MWSRDKETVLMPQYELMYLLGANVADDQVPAISEQIKNFVADFGGTNVVETQLGKKKLAYAIGKTRNGHYVTVNFTMDGKKVNELDAKVRNMDQTVIRYILLNLDEHNERMAKDKVAQSKMTRRQPEEQTAETEEKSEESKAKAPLVEIDEEALNSKIEAALTEDVTK